MVTRILAVVAALFAALALHEYNQVGDLRREIAAVEARGSDEARLSVINSMSGYGGDVQRATEWLHEFYKSDDGLRRPEGLWIDGRPDFEGIGVWIYGVYLPHRLKGESDEKARQAIETAIKRSEEWRGKHPSAR